MLWDAVLIMIKWYNEVLKLQHSSVSDWKVGCALCIHFKMTIHYKRYVTVSSMTFQTSINFSSYISHYRVMQLRAQWPGAKWPLEANVISTKRSLPAETWGIRTNSGMISRWSTDWHIRQMADGNLYLLQPRANHVSFGSVSLSEQMLRSWANVLSPPCAWLCQDGNPGRNLRRQERLPSYHGKKGYLVTTAINLGGV